MTTLNSKSLERRLVNCLPAATFELETFCRLAGIVVSEKIPTAAVECTYRPRLLINPNFVEKYCQRDEHLFLLVMHELWHITLAHTRMYPRATKAHNIAFDAIINAGLSRMFPAPEYRGFFESVNPVEDFPQVLLRPPKGWPHTPEYPENIGPVGTTQIVKRLYPPENKTVQPPFYEEILALLRQYAKENGFLWEGDIVLLGNHDDPDKEAKVMDNPLLKDIMKKVAKRWDKTKIIGNKKAGVGGDPELLMTEVERTTRRAQRVFSNTLKRCLNPNAGGQKRKAKQEVEGISGISVLPNARDRTASAKRSLGAPTTLWNHPGTVKARVPNVPSKAYIYLDVSGSMREVLPHLLGLITPYVVRGQAEVFQFSTAIRPLPVKALKAGTINTSGGTNVNCVLEHLLNAKPKIRKMLILTDGYTGYPDELFTQQAQAEHVRIHVVLPAEDSSTEQLQNIATTMTILPSIYPGSRW